MRTQANSLTLVIIGSWSKYYSEPMWLGENVLNTSKVTVEFQFSNIEGIGIVIRNEACSIQPTTNRVTLTCLNLSKEGIEEFEKHCRTFIDKVSTPYIEAYGLNVIYSDTDATRFALSIDGLPDIDSLAKVGAEIKNTFFTREIEYEGMNLNVNYSIKNQEYVIGFNQHIACNKSNKDVELKPGFVKHFMDNVRDLLVKTDYEVEDEGE